MFFTFAVEKYQIMKKQQDDEKLPGYPHYPASEDITQPYNSNGKESWEPISIPHNFNDTVDNEDIDTSFVFGTDADITEDDLRILETSEQNMNTRDAFNLINSSLDTTDDDGDPLNELGSIIDDVSGSDLDVPGSEDDDDMEELGEEDEENNYYSLGDDNHENQEESKG